MRAQKVTRSHQIMTILHIHQIMIISKCVHEHGQFPEDKIQFYENRKKLTFFFLN